MLAASLVGYIVLAYRLERTPAALPPSALPSAALPSASPHGEIPVRTPRVALARSLALAAVGLGLVVFGAGWLVDSAITIAESLGVSDTLIGLTLVAVGTSLPELTVTVMAALRGQGDMAFGNIVGSNIYNVFGILGITALVAPVQVPAEIVAFDGWVMLAATAALILVTVTGWRINRAEGGLLLGGYAAYLGWLGAVGS
jgi:cation:H+ antiporter